jgi:hypothetical protein
MKKIFRRLREKKDGGKWDYLPKRTTATNKEASDQEVTLARDRLWEIATIRGRDQPMLHIFQPWRFIALLRKSCCPVCYSLDPNNAPPEGGGPTTQVSWAVKEYSIDPQTAGGKIAITDVKLLHKNAEEAGCFHCKMICMSLDTIHPGWQNEQAFLHIFVAAGLPAVVRLQFGTIHFSPPIEREFAGRMGTALSEGVNLQVAATVRPKDDLRPDVEFEIYRPKIPKEGPIFSGMFILRGGKLYVA